MTPTEYIASIRAAEPNAVQRYTQGDCLVFHFLLRARFPHAQPWYDEIACHVLTEIDGVLYDVTGEVCILGQHPAHVVPWERTSEQVQVGAIRWAYRAEVA